MRGSLLEVRAKEGARVVALSHLEQAASAAARLHDPNDVEALHDFRVALRRLRSSLRAYAPLLEESIGERHRRRLSKLASRTGPGRDAEVQLAWIDRLSEGDHEAARWLREHLEAQRAVAYSHLREDLSRRFDRMHEKLRARLATYTQTVHLGEPPSSEPSFGRFTAGVLAGELELLGATLREVEGLDDQARIHRARIAGKRIRYLLEPFRGHVDGVKEAVRALKRLQEGLGDLNDLTNLARLAGDAIEESAVRRSSEPIIVEESTTGAEPSADERASLAAFLQSVQRERASLWARLDARWRGEERALASLEADVRAIVARLSAEPKPPVEIERKYLLRGRPPIVEGREATELAQGYLPGTRLIERIRRKRTAAGESYARTVKLGAGMVRIEVEEACDAAVFETLWSLTEGRRVEKRRYAIEDGELVWEIDEFLDRELWLAEVELPSEDLEVVIPEWLAPYVERDVTDEAAYVNANLAR